ncbi:glycosyltransferase [Acidithiobacillus montserratensis]|uniref:Glycosyltransferase n=1 Tax=Acidithiobacillus montserratensis TaxID=2729135 RepID=A0ACD5HJ73_9PROT
MNISTAENLDSVVGNSLVSIIVPTYRPDFLVACLESAISQTHLNIEIMVSDDCPTDAVEKIMRSYQAKDSRIFYKRNKVPLGEAGNLMQGIRMAHGEFIKPLYDDDLLEPNAVERLVNIWHLYPNVRLAAGRRIPIDESGKPLGTKHLWVGFTEPVSAVDSCLNGKNVLGKILGSRINNLGEPSCMMFRRQDALSITEPDLMTIFGRPCPNMGDVCIAIQMLSLGDLAYVAEPVVRFRIHTGQLSQRAETKELWETNWQYLQECAGRLAIPLLERTVCQVFWQGNEGFYVETNSHCHILYADNERREVIVPFPKGAAQALRFDPADRPGSMILYAVRLLAGSEILWSWNGDLKTIRKWSKNDIALSELENEDHGVRLHLLSDDPFLELPLSSLQLSKADGLALEFKLEESAFASMHEVRQLPLPNLMPYPSGLSLARALISQMKAEKKPQCENSSMSAGYSDLRTLIVTPDIVGPIRNGGIGTAFSALALFAAQSGMRVSVLYTLGKHSEHWSIANCVNYYAQGRVEFIPLLPDPHTPRSDAPWPRRNSYEVYGWLREHGDNYDLIIFPEWHAEAYYTLLARHQGLMLQHAQIWVNTHGPSAWSMEGNYQLPREAELVELDFMERETVRLADGVVSPSAYLLDWMREHQWQIPKQALVIQNLMVDELVTHASAATALDQIDELVFFGRLEARKGLFIFCDAMDRLAPELQAMIRRITFLGKALPVDVFDSFGYIQRRAAAWKTPVVIQTEYDREQALEFLTESPFRLAVIASLVENSPYTVLECLHHQIRFLATNIGGIPELIDSEDHSRVLFPPRPAALARLLENAVTEGLAPARRALTAEQVETQWSAFFAQITAQPRHELLSLPYAADTQPLVSVCMPHHDSPDTLRMALDSLYRQTYEHYEIIVVDDGSSTEEALQMLDSLERELAEKGGRLIRQENAYPGAARNQAVAHARGDYLFFMDDDNLAMSQELETFVAVALRTDADILTTVSAVFTGKSPPEEPRHLWLPLGPATGAGVYRNVFGDMNSFWKKSAFYKVGGFTEDYGIGHEDWEIFAKATLMGLHLELVPEPLFWYRATVGGVQTAGDMAAYLARNARPYLQHDPHGLGMLAAHAAWARFSTAAGISSPALDVKSSWRTALSLTRRSDLYAKFRITVKRYGLKTAIGKTIRYIRSHSG